MAMEELREKLTDYFVDTMLETYAKGILFLYNADGYSVCAGHNTHMDRDGTPLWTLVELGLVESERKSDGDPRGGLEYFRYRLTPEGMDMAERLIGDMGPARYAKLLGSLDVSSVLVAPPFERKPGF